MEYIWKKKWLIIKDNKIKEASTKESASYWILKKKLIKVKLWMLKVIIIIKSKRKALYGRNKFLNTVLHYN